MTDPGLTDRLRQKSRRAGLAVGLSMALTIAICIGGATVIYAALVEPLSQFIPIPPAQQAVPEPNTGNAGGLSDVPELDAPPDLNSSSQEVAAVPTEAPPEPSPTPTAEPTPTSEAFEPTHQIRGDQAVNLRTEPSRSDSGIIQALQPSTPLQFLGEEAPTENPVEDGDVWMRFRTSQGEEGWVREIDVSTYTP